MLDNNQYYLRIICNKFTYLSIQIILFVLVLSLDAYDTTQNEWGAIYIIRCSLVLICILMVLRFNFLNYSPTFLTGLVVLSCCAIFYEEIIILLNQFTLTKDSVTFLIENHAKSIISSLITIFVITSLISGHKTQIVEN